MYCTQKCDEELTNSIEASASKNYEQLFSRICWDCHYILIAKHEIGNLGQNSTPLAPPVVVLAKIHQTESSQEESKYQSTKTSPNHSKH